MLRRTPAVRPISSRRTAYSATLLAGVSALALVAASGPADAVCLGRCGGGGVTSATTAAATAAIMSAQQAAAATQQSMNSLSRATQAVQAMQAAQTAAHNLALGAPSSVPNGLVNGGLVPDSGLAASGAANSVLPSQGGTWIGLQTPTQTTSGGQTLVTITQTQQGGNISILGPGGRILVGSADAAPAVNPASEGILTLEKGNIDIFDDRDVLVAQSRIMTEQGGGIIMWSSNGNLDAGEGAKTSVSAPPPKFDCDIGFHCSADIKGQVSGAGIATLQSLPGVPVGDANLMAPRGTINAGAAGVRVSGNLNLVALQVLNAFNIQVQGTITGLPTFTGPSFGTLTTASNVAGAVQATIPVPSNSNNNQASIIIVEVIGYGGGDGGTETPAQPPDQGRTKNDHQTQDINSRFQVIGAGNLTDEQTEQLRDENRKLIGR